MFHKTEICLDAAASQSVIYSTGFHILYSENKKSDFQSCSGVQRTDMGAGSFNGGGEVFSFNGAVY